MQRKLLGIIRVDFVCGQLYIYFPQNIQNSHKVPCVVSYVSCHFVELQVWVLMMTCSSLWQLGRSLAGHSVSFVIQRFQI